MSQSVSRSSIAAHGMFELALAELVVEWRIPEIELRRRLRKGDCLECEALRNHLARKIALDLAIADPALRSVYRFDPTFAFGEDGRDWFLPSESSGINLLAWTTAKTGELADHIAALSKAFAEARQDWLCPKAVVWCHSLYIVVVDDAGVKARQGFAVLLDSVWVRPTQLWSRSPEVSPN